MQPTDLLNRLSDSLHHEQIKKRLEYSSRHIVKQMETIQELRNKYGVKGMTRELR